MDPNEYAEYFLFRRGLCYSEPMGTRLNILRVSKLEEHRLRDCCRMFMARDKHALPALAPQSGMCLILGQIQNLSYWQIHFHY